MSTIQKIELSCSDHDCYTDTIPVTLDEVDEDMECVVPGGLLMEVRRILRDLVAQSELFRKVSSYGPCAIDAQELLFRLNNAKDDGAPSGAPVHRLVGQTEPQETK